MDTVSSLFLSLPIDLLQSISVYVAKRSTKDHLSLKMTCRELREISELSPVYESVFLLDLDHNYWNNDEAFLKKCYDHGNPYAIYMKGCHDFFIFGEQDKGLAKMRLTADKGSDVALYTFAMLRQIICDDFSHLRRISRETIFNTSIDFIKRLRRFQPNYPDSIEVKKMDEEDVYYLIHNCKCTPYHEWFYWFDKDAKGLFITVSVPLTMNGSIGLIRMLKVLKYVSNVSGVEKFSYFLSSLVSLLLLTPANGDCK